MKSRRTLILCLVLAIVACAFVYSTSEVSSQEEIKHQSRSYLFTGKLDKTIPYPSLPEGSVQELLNMQRPAPGIPVGWKARAGTTRHNTTAIAAAEVKGIWQITNSDLSIRKTLAQANDAVYVADVNPPATASAFGSSLASIPTGTSPFFCDRIGDDLVFAGTGSTPYAYSGASAWPDGVYVKHETGTTVYDSGWNKVRDNRQDTNLIWVAHNGVSEFAYVGFRRRLSGFSLDLLTGATNIMASGTTVSAYRSGVWTDVSGLVDGTKSSNGVTTLYQSGHIAWTASDLDTPHVLQGTKDHLFWYRTGVTANVTDSVKVWRVKVNDRMEPVTSLWSGLYDIALSCLQSSVTGYVDWTGEITAGNDSEYMDLGSLATDQAIYVGFANPAFGLWVNLVSGNENQGTNCGIKISYWNAGSNAWTEVSGVTYDGTSSNGKALNHPGVIQWDGQTIREDMRTIGGRATPLYYYKLQWTATLPADLYIWEIGQMQKPDTVPPMPEYDGVFEYNGRAAFWPGVKYRHGIDFSQDNYPHIMTGAKTTSTGNIFGPGIPNAAVRFSSYGVVSTKDPYRLYLLEGKVPGKFDELMISDKVGAVAPHSMVVIEDAVKIFQATRTVHAVFLLAPDGTYLTQGQNVYKISQPISSYWDTNGTQYIEPAYAHLSYAWVDYQEKTVHLAVPMNLTGTGTQTILNRELVYSYIADEWYDQYARYSPARCGADIIGSDNQRMAYVGDYSGYLYRTGVSTTDYGYIITHHVKTADFTPLAGQLTNALNYSSILRAIKAKTKAQSKGDVEVVIYPDGYTSGVTPTSGNTISMVNSGYGYSYGRVNTNDKGESFAIRFRAGVAAGDLGVVMEIPGFSVDYYPLRDTQVEH